MFAINKKLPNGRFQEVAAVADELFTEEAIQAERDKFPNHEISLIEIPNFKIGDFFNAIVATNILLTDVNETRIANGLEPLDLQSTLGYKLRPLVEYLGIFNIDINRTQLEVFEPYPSLVSDYNSWHDQTIALLGLLSVEELEVNHLQYIEDLKAFIAKYQELTNLFLAKQQEAQLANDTDLLPLAITDEVEDAVFEETTPTVNDVPEEYLGETDFEDEAINIEEPVAEDHELITAEDI